MIGGRRSARSVPPAWLAPIAIGAVAVIVVIAVIGIASGERSRPAAPLPVFDAPVFRAEERAAMLP